jgi:putative ABC transport system permease protein
MAEHNRPSAAERLYRLLLFVYPRRYRARFGVDMVATWTADHARVRATGLHSLVGFWAVTLVQAVKFGASERLHAFGRNHSEALMHTDARSRWPIATDTRYAVRLLARSPLFTGTAVLSLAMGLAAATTVYSLAEALLFRASPGVRDPAGVIDIARTTNGVGYGTLSYPMFLHLRRHTNTLQSIAATGQTPVPLSLSDGRTAEHVFGQTVSARFFDVLGVRPSMGRFFRPGEDEVPDQSPVVVLSHRLWQRRFGSDSNILGRSIRLNGTGFTVIGIAQAGFDGETILSTDVWLPIAMAATVRGERSTDLLSNPDATWHRALGHLRPGISMETARAELNVLFENYKTATPTVPASYGIGVAAAGRLTPPARARFAPFIALLFLFATGLLAIACSNVAGMLLARSITRHREIATRLALGASRAHLLGQLLIETLLLFLAGGLLALPLAMWTMSALQAMLPPLSVPVDLNLAVTPRVVLFALGTAFGAGLIFGLAPARQALGTDITQQLRGWSATAGRRRLRLRHALVIAQVALSLALATVAGLFVRTLDAAARLDRGFQTANIDVVTLDTTLAGAAASDRVDLVDRIAGRLRAVGGIESAAHARMIPLVSGSLRLGGIHVPGLSDARNARVNDADWDVVSPDYFRTLGVSLVAGRDFGDRDREGSPEVAIVNQTFASHAWPDRPAVGQRFWRTTGQGDPERPVEVIGVVGDAKYHSSTEAPRPFVYVPFRQNPQAHVELFVRHAPGHSVLEDVRAVISGVDPRLPIVQIQPLEEAVAGEFFPQRLAAWTAGSLGSIGMFLAALGLYGLVAFLVAQRAREIAIRMALGASEQAVWSMVLRQAARLGAIGAGLGLALAAGLGVVVQSLLVGVPPTDPVTFGGLVLLMASVLFAASYGPARRAARTDPAVALRAE